mmetsp:Transcript_51397/g.96357  ORF Transcript_51397/g.96357 Transcript_51397/m.96357 type:complete len:252 (+) Transcript_51397:819-1574(+)
MHGCFHLIDDLACHNKIISESCMCRIHNFHDVSSHVSARLLEPLFHRKAAFLLPPHSVLQIFNALGGSLRTHLQTFAHLCLQHPVGVLHGSFQVIGHLAGRHQFRSECIMRGVHGSRDILPHISATLVEPLFYRKTPVLFPPHNVFQIFMLHSGFAQRILQIALAATKIREQGRELLLHRCELLSQLLLFQLLLHLVIALLIVNLTFQGPVRFLQPALHLLNCLDMLNQRHTQRLMTLVYGIRKVPANLTN